MSETQYRLFRPVVRRLLEITSPQEIHETVAGAIRQAREHFRSGNPVWSFFSHMSKADGPHELKFLAAAFPESAGRIVMPIALHTYNSFNNTGVLRLTDIAYGVNWKPVVTKRTIEEGQGTSTVGGVREYRDTVRHATRNGDIVAAALQAGGNLPRYGDPTRVFSTLVRSVMDKNLVPNVGIQFVAIIPKHSLTDGRDAHGGQFLRTMRMNVGPFVTLPDVMIHIGQDPKQLDEWAYNRMKDILPGWYTR